LSIFPKDIFLRPTHLLLSRSHIILNLSLLLDIKMPKLDGFALSEKI
jgi:CheY-like chemotaxis protein